MFDPAYALDRHSPGVIPERRPFHAAAGVYDPNDAAQAVRKIWGPNRWLHAPFVSWQNVLRFERGIERGQPLRSNPRTSGELIDQFSRRHFVSGAIWTHAGKMGARISPCSVESLYLASRERVQRLLDRLDLKALRTIERALDHVYGAIRDEAVEQGLALDVAATWPVLTGNAP
jgi:hypothetical protein